MRQPIFISSFIPKGSFPRCPQVNLTGRQLLRSCRYAAFTKPLHLL